LGYPILLVGRYHGAAPSIVSFGDQTCLVRPTVLGGRQPLAGMWARRKIAELAGSAEHRSDVRLETQEKDLALEYGLESPFTSFVVVDAVRH
jgi:hypothetical protein